MEADKHPPSDFATWEQCRSYYSLEALFLGQIYERSKTRGNEQRYKKAARLAVEANANCANPLPEEPTDG